MKRTVLAILSAALLAGCGLKGPLYLPENAPKKPRAQPTVPAEQVPAEQAPVQDNGSEKAPEAIDLQSPDSLQSPS